MFSNAVMKCMHFVQGGKHIFVQFYITMYNIVLCSLLYERLTALHVSISHFISCLYFISVVIGCTYVLSYLLGLPDSAHPAKTLYDFASS